MIKFTFLMVAYNSEKYIVQSIESVLHQTYPCWELLIVYDKGSSDSTYEIISKYSVNDSRIRIVDCEHTSIPSVARNVGLDYATGGYLQILDSDDYISESLLEKYVSKITGLNVDVVFPDAYMVSDDKEVLRKWTPFTGDYETVLQGEEAFYYSIDWKVHGWFCIRSSIVKKIRYYEKTFNGDEYSARCYLHEAQNAVFVDGVYWYRYNTNSITKNEQSKIKMFRNIETEWLLYLFSTENNLAQNCIDKCAKHFLENYTSRIEYANIEKENGNKSLFEEANELLMDYYSKALKLSRDSWTKYSLPFFLSMGAYSRYYRLVIFIKKFKAMF